MKLRFNFGITASLIAMAALASEASAAQIFKDVTSTDINTVGNWSTTSLASTPEPSAIGSTETLRFNEYFAPTSGTNYTASISSDLTIGGIKLDSGSAGGGTAFGNVTIDGTSALTLNGTTSADSQYAGAIFVLNSATGGTLTVNPNVVIGAASTQIVASRNLTLNGTLNWGTFGMANNIAGQTTTVSGVVSGSGNWSKSGAGTYHFNNASNDFTGSVTVAGGTLLIEKLADGGSTSSIGSGSSAIVLNGGALATSATATGGTTNRVIEMRAGASILSSGLSPISFTATNVTHSLAASARTLTLGGVNTGDNTFAPILGNSGTATNISRLQKSGAGKWIITAPHTYTGATIINQGTLVVSGSAAIGGASGSTTDESNIWFSSVQSHGTLQFESIANLGPADQIRFRNTGGTSGNGGALVYVGSTDQTLSKTIQCDSSIGIRVESNSVAGKLIFNGAFIQTNRTLYLGGSGSGDNTLAAAFTGTGGVQKRGTGKWILAATNTYSGTTNISDGTLIIGQSDAIASSAISLGSATLATAPAISDTLGALDATAAAVIHIGTGATLAFADSAAIDWTGGTLAISGSFVPGASLRFGLNSEGLTPAQLSQITSSGYTAFTLDERGYLTATVATGYASWAAANGTAGALDLDHDNDGVPNGIEYLIGGPLGNTSGFTPLASVVNSGGSLTVTWPKAASYTGVYGTNYEVETSSTLNAPWTSISEGAGSDKVQITSNAIIYTFPSGVKNFARLKVTGP
jgi:fibronectin-binding autotransporter adhesin